MATYEIHGIHADSETRTLVIDGESVRLTPFEFAIFDVLARSPGTAFSRRMMIDSAQGDDSPTAEQAVNVHVNGLRKKLGTRRDLIETVRGISFRIKPE